MKNVCRFLLKFSLYGLFLLLILFGTAYFLTKGDYRVPKTVETDLSLPVLKIGSLKLHVETYGDPNNQSVVLVHGGPGGDYRYLLPLKALYDKYYVVFYDQRGTGLSQRVDQNQMTMENYYKDLNYIVDHYSKGKKVNLIGHSWGGMLVAGYLGKYPDKVDHAILAEPGFLTTEMADKILPQIMKFRFNSLYPFAKAWFKKLHVDNSVDQEASNDFFFSQIMTHVQPTDYFCSGEVLNIPMWRPGFTAFQGSIASQTNKDGKFEINLIEGVHRFKRKVLFMTGDCNKLIGVEHQKLQMKYFSNRELVIIKNAGHYMFNENLKNSLKSIRKYFKE